MNEFENSGTFPFFFFLLFTYVSSVAMELMVFTSFLSSSALILFVRNLELQLTSLLFLFRKSHRVFSGYTAFRFSLYLYHNLKGCKYIFIHQPLDQEVLFLVLYLSLLHPRVCNCFLPLLYSCLFSCLSVLLENIGVGTILKK